MTSWLLAAVLASVAPAAPVTAESPPQAVTEAAYDPLLSELDVRTDVAPRAAPLGAEMTWTVGVTHPAEGSVGFAEPFTGGPLTVKRSAVEKLTPGQSRVRIVLTGLDLGEFTLPPLRLRFTGADGSDHPFNVLGGKVRVTPSGGEPGNAELVAPVPIYRWNPWFFGALALLAAAGAGYLWWRRRRPSLPPPPPPAPVDPRTPSQRALEAIFKLQAEGLLERREVKAFGYALDDIVRAYLIETHGAGEPAQTSDEFLRALRGKAHPDAVARAAAFFGQGDRVRFAGEEHEVAEARALLDAAVDLVKGKP